MFPRAESALPVAELVSAAERRAPYLDNIVTPAESRSAVYVFVRAAPRHFWKSDNKKVKKRKNGRFFAKKMPLLCRRSIDKSPYL